RVVPERLSSMDVRQVHLGHRQVHRAQRVGDGNRSVCQRTGIDHDAAAVVAGIVDLVDQDALVVALHRTQVVSVFGGGRGRELLDVGERDGAVYLGFAAAEQVQVRPVDEE